MGKTGVGYPKLVWARNLWAALLPGQIIMPFRQVTQIATCPYFGPSLSLGK